MARSLRLQHQRHGMANLTRAKDAAALLALAARHEREAMAA